jgi:predicted small lipoprotein YifL
VKALLILLTATALTVGCGLKVPETVPVRAQDAPIVEDPVTAAPGTDVEAPLETLPEISLPSLPPLPPPVETVIVAAAQSNRAEFPSSHHPRNP